MTGECDGDVNCAETIEHIEEFLDGAVDKDLRTRISDHLEECGHCSERSDFEQHLRSFVRSRCAEHAPDSLLERVSARLDQFDRT